MLDSKTHFKTLIIKTVSFFAPTSDVKNEKSPEKSKSFRNQLSMCIFRYCVEYKGVIFNKLLGILTNYLEVKLNLKSYLAAMTKI